jgi:hypothetical protein
MDDLTQRRKGKTGVSELLRLCSISNSLTHVLSS